MSGRLHALVLTRGGSTQRPLPGRGTEPDA